MTSSGRLGSSTPVPVQRSEEQRGVIAGVAAYGLWGLFPIYFHALAPAGALEILSNRILWSLLVVISILAWKRDWSWCRPLLRDRRQLIQLGAASVFIAINWLVYVWAVAQDRILEASLGYFINPLVTVMFGVVILHEKLRRLQWAAVALGAMAVAVIGIAYGRFPYVSLTLAFSFASYGFIKKQVALGPVRSLTAETFLLAPVAAAVLIQQSATGRLAFASNGPRLSALLALSGIVTAIPLLLFAASARRIPLTLLGLLQYLTPVMQFLCAVLIFDEKMAPARWIGFGLVWAALAMLSGDAIRHLRTTVEPTPVDEAQTAASFELG